MECFIEQQLNKRVSQVHTERAPSQNMFWAMKHILRNFKEQKPHKVCCQATLELNWMESNNKKVAGKVPKYLNIKEHIYKKF